MWKTMRQRRESWGQSPPAGSKGGALVGVWRAKPPRSWKAFKIHLAETVVTSAKEVIFLPDFVFLSVCLCVNKITQKFMDGSFWNFEGMSGMAQTTCQWFNFGGDSEGILDSALLWNFRYHCFQWGIRETTAKPKMVLSPSEQHCLGGDVRALTAF